MKSSYKEVKERQEAIIDFVKEKKSTTVDTLVKVFNVSPATIRRDLVTLANIGQIEKSFGKVTSKENIIDYDHKNENMDRIKDELAKIAANFIDRDSTIFINSSSAAAKVSKYLASKRVNIITNNVKVAFEDHHPQSTIVLTSGEVRYPKEALVGSYTIDFIEKVQADIAVIGCYGLSIKDGLTTPVLAEAKINNMMIKNTRKKVIAIADYRKLGNIATFKSAEAKQIDYLITDSYADQKIIKELEDIGIIVVQINI